MRLIKDAAAGRKEDLEMLPGQLAVIVAHHSIESRIHPQNGTAIGEDEEAARRVIEGAVHLGGARHFRGRGLSSEIVLDDANRFIRMAHVRTMSRRFHYAKGAAGKMPMGVFADRERRNCVV